MAAARGAPEIGARSRNAGQTEARRAQPCGGQLDPDTFSRHQESHRIGDSLKLIGEVQGACLAWRWTPATATVSGTTARERRAMAPVWRVTRSGCAIMTVLVVSI